MTFWQALVIGIIQGLTEFIPVSSSAHMVFAARLTHLFQDLDAQTRAEQTTAVMAVTQLGTLAAVFVYFARDIWNISNAFVRDHLALIGIGSSTAKFNRDISSHNSGTFFSRLPLMSSLSNDARLGWLVILGSLPIGIIGLLFKDEIEGTFTKNLWVIATMMIVIGIALFIAERISKRTREMKDLGLRDAIAVGFTQVIALIPGASRSGSTIMGGLLVGETRETAARFSFLLSIPAITASGLLQLKEAIETLPSGNFAPLLVATIIAGLVGYASIWFLISYLRKHSTDVFIFYRIVVGIAILLLLRAGMIAAN